jgi:AcrR family transcriptional regulator
MAHASIKSPTRRRSRPRRGRPRDRALHERRRAQILDKATEVFAKHGYPNTDVQFIADPLRISKGTVYRYFPSKERLFLAAVERGVRHLEEHMNRAIEAEPDGVQRMAVATRAYLEFFDAHPALAELFIQERAEFRDRKKPVYFDRDCANEEPWRQSLRQLIATGRLRDVPVERIMNVLGDLVYGTMFTNYFAGRDRSFEEQAADIVDVVFNGILTEGEKRRRSPIPESPNGNGRQKSH